MLLISLGILEANVEKQQKRMLVPDCADVLGCGDSEIDASILSEYTDGLFPHIIVRHIATSTGTRGVYSNRCAIVHMRLVWGLDSRLGSCTRFTLSYEVINLIKFRPFLKLSMGRVWRV
jgi:hypothetical protein